MFRSRKSLVDSEGNSASTEAGSGETANARDAIADIRIELIEALEEIESASKFLYSGNPQAEQAVRLQRRGESAVVDGETSDSFQSIASQLPLTFSDAKSAQSFADFVLAMPHDHTTELAGLLLMELGVERDTSSQPNSEVWRIIDRQARRSLAYQPASHSDPVMKSVIELILAGYSGSTSGCRHPLEMDRGKRAGCRARRTGGIGHGRPPTEPTG